MTGQHINLNMDQVTQIAKDRFWQLRANDDWQGSASYGHSPTDRITLLPRQGGMMNHHFRHSNSQSIWGA